MFVAEAQLTSRLQHPNIVSVLDFDRDAEKRLFLVMELVEGKDLDDLMAHRPVAVPGRDLRGVRDAARARLRPHLPAGEGGPRGIIHRDVSPHNVLLSWDGAVKVSDFGIAKARSASNATASVFIKGKPAYMSPEQANGSNLDGRSDLFAAGIMLWELLVGHRLFVAEDTRGTLAKVLFARIPAPAEHRADVPPDLNAITMKLLDRELDARYPTCEDALDDLMACHDAPRNGRDELAMLLAARFPSEAPARPRRNSLPGGGVRAPLVGTGSEPIGRSPALGVPAFIATAPLSPSEPIAAAPTGAATPALVPVAAPGAPTWRPGQPAVAAVTFAGVPAAADVTPPLPSEPAVAVRSPTPTPDDARAAMVQALQGAPTRTMVASADAGAPAPALADAPDAPRSPARLIALGLLVAVAAGVSLFLALRSRAPAAAPGLTATSGSDDDGAGRAAAPSAPKGVGPATTAASSSTAGSGALLAAGSGSGSGSGEGSSGPRAAIAAGSSATPPTAGSNAAAAGSAVAVPAAARRGEIKVTVDPWAYVSVNGSAPKLTPFAGKFAPGKYSVRIWNEDLGKNVTRSLTVDAGETERVDLTW
jgi:hypothetical protein